VKTFRAAWVATVRNLDFPVAPDEDVFRDRFRQVLDTLADWNMNAVIFQVRPMLDAFYPSAINPWSRFLTGKQGEAPAGDWNPLALMVEETHKRGLEYHAWLNPYRVTGERYSDDTFPGFSPDEMPMAELLALYVDSGVLAAGNFAVLHPHAVYRHAGLLYLDAGLPEVRRHIVDTVTEIVRNHDVDAIHFDDYFYPYNVPEDEMIGITRTAFDLHRNGFADDRQGRGAWLRHNNDEMIYGVRRAILAENGRSGRNVRFGVSPFGVWWNLEHHPDGSPTGDTTFTYSGGVYADTRKWVLEGWIDYIVAQLYWERSHATAPFEPLARWWAELCSQSPVDLYIGHGNYKHVTAPFHELDSWLDAREILEQVTLAEKLGQVKGSVFFAFNHLSRTDSGGPNGQVLLDSNRLLREHLRGGRYRGIGAVWTMAEQFGGKLKAVSFELLARGRILADKLGVPLVSVLIGDGACEEELAALIRHGADEVYSVQDRALADFVCEPYALVLEKLIADFSPAILLAAATSSGRTLLPYVAVKVHTGLTADCTELDIEEGTRNLLQTRPAIGGNIMATIKTPDCRPQIATVRPKSSRPLPEDKNRSGTVRHIPFDHAAGKVKVTGYRQEGEGGASLEEADVVVAGGRGLKKAEGFAMVRGLAEMLGGAVGASRDAVDRAWVSYPHQVGLSGKTVSPKVYIAAGVSGSIQYLAGIQTGEAIISVNPDPQAAIHSLADLGIVGDAFRVLPALAKRLEGRFGGK